ncbi:CRE-SRG-14 protein [Caenorhabditis remanei]|uniref:Serpentine receptor class gamma n=1 Tax=Caenorhabditis remanei TaxID=31234 RepID=E3MUN6_CAERE|nr:CRE-SRG-14 protein [Caenorhabditis remanei]
MPNLDTDPIPVTCDESYHPQIEMLKFLVQYLYLITGLIINLSILYTLWWKHPKVYRSNSFFVLFSVDCVVNTLLLLTDGLMARLLIYLTPLCPILKDYFSSPLTFFKFIMILIFHSRICKSIIQFLLVFNRMTCVIFPISHDSIWSKKFLKILIPIIFVIPVSVDWNLAIARVFMQSTYGGFWVNYFKKVSWASQSRFLLVFIVFALFITIICTFLTLLTLIKLPERSKNLEKSISNATLIISIGFSGTAAFQIYYGFFFVYSDGSHPIFGLNFLSWDFLTVGSPIVMLCVSSSLRRHVLGKNGVRDVRSTIRIRTRTI